MGGSSQTAGPSAPPIYVKFLGAALSLVVFVAVVELALCIAQPDLYCKNQFFPVNRDIDFPEIYEKDSRLFWRFRKDFVTESRMFSYLNYHINAQGVRGPDFDERTQGYCIMAMGNSCTFGWGVPYEGTCSYLLQELLKVRLNRDDISVINAGIPGYSSYQGRIYFEQELVDLRPDMVLVMYGWNDHWKAGHNISDAEQRMAHRLILKAQNLFSRLKLYQCLRKLVLSATEQELLVALDDTSGKRRVSLEEFYDNLKAIVRLARSRDITPVLLVPPMASAQQYFGMPTSTLHYLHRTYQKQIVRVAELEQMPLVDLQAVFDRYNDLYDAPEEDPIHFNAKGHAVAAEAVAQVVAELIPSN